MKRLIFVFGFFLLVNGLAKAEVPPEPEYIDDPEVYDLNQDDEGSFVEGEDYNISEASQEDFKSEKITYKAEVVNIDRFDCADDEEGGNHCLTIEYKFLTGDKKGENMIGDVIDTRFDLLIDVWDLQKGDKVVVTEFINGDFSNFQITEIYRVNGIIWFVLIYVVLVLAVGRLQGFGSLLGLCLSFFVILKVVIPMTLAGWDPILVSILGGLAVLLPSIYLSHGFSRKTTIALFGTVIGLVSTGILAAIAINVTHLTGFGAEESIHLAGDGEDAIDLGGVLLASIIIGGIGLIDDVTVGQVSVIKEIYEENKNISTLKLYGKAMNVGRDHIASMVNTLFLAYVAASLPLILVLVDQNASFADLINMETFAEEIVRTLVASTGLVLTVPITTYIAARYYVEKSSKPALPKLSS